jgi:predicted  nucleic acid-binding Zn-ribbon protein
MKKLFIIVILFIVAIGTASTVIWGFKQVNKQIKALQAEISRQSAEISQAPKTVDSIRVMRELDRLRLENDRLTSQLEALRAQNREVWDAQEKIVWITQDIDQRLIRLEEGKPRVWEGEQ